MKKGPKTIPPGLQKDFSHQTARRLFRRARTKILIIYKI